MLFLFWACAPSDTEAINHAKDIVLYDAGFRVIQFTDQRGKELEATIWYPTVVEEDAEVDGYEPFAIQLEGYYGAPMRASHAPLVAFSHGFRAFRFQSAYLMEHLAQQGYVVIAVDHPGNTFSDFDDDLTAQVLVERPDDMRAAVDELIALSEDDGSVFYGAVDGSRYAAMGHSFGAHTANVLGGGRLDYQGLIDYCAENQEARACGYLEGFSADMAAGHGAQDDRVVAVVPMSPGLWYTFGEDGAGLSFVENSLSFIGTYDEVLEYETEARPAYESTGSPKMALVIEGTGHYGCSNICDVAPFMAADCTAEGWTDVGFVQETTEIVITAFLDRHLKGIDSEVLEPSYWDDQPLVALWRE